MEESIRDMVIPYFVGDAYIVSDRLMSVDDEVVLRNRSAYKKFKEDGDYPFLKVVSILETGTGFKNCETSSKTLEENQIALFYIADLEFTRFSQRGYPVYKITSDLIFDGYYKGVPYEESVKGLKDILVDDDEDFEVLEELDIS